MTPAFLVLSATRLRIGAVVVVAAFLQLMVLHPEVASHEVVKLFLRHRLGQRGWLGRKSPADLGRTDGARPAAAVLRVVLAALLRVGALGVAATLLQLVVLEPEVTLQEAVQLLLFHRLRCRRQETSLKLYICMSVKGGLTC